MPQDKKPFALIILDGFGYSEKNNHNAINLANTPHWDSLWANNPKCLLDCSGLSVGLPNNQMGNSEVGHMNIGAGRVIYQDLTKIDQDIKSGEFNTNPELLALLEDNTPLHLCGLVSEGGVHSHLNHFLAVVELARLKKFSNQIYIHAFLDGRDTPPKSALPSLIKLDNLLKTYNLGKIVSLIGRYYAMDRDKRFERTELASKLLTGNLEPNQQQCYIYPDIPSAIEAAYNRGETDEFILPTVIADNTTNYKSYFINNYSANSHNILFMNFRADRVRQICTELKQKLSSNILNKLVTMTEYLPELTPYIAYKPEQYHNMLGEFLSFQGLTQLRISETEKYAHVTFFLNGGREEPFPNEDRVLIPSPKVSTYDLKPEMSAFELTEKLCENITNHKYDAIFCNYPNPDMVGHTGNLDATIKAIEVIDECLAKITKAIDTAKGSMLITADHGNAEFMYDESTKQPHTAHTQSLVPLLYYNSNKLINTNNHELPMGTLADIAPTMLYLMGLKPPSEMTGKILFEQHD